MGPNPRRKANKVYVFILAAAVLMVSILDNAQGAGKDIEDSGVYSNVGNNDEKYYEPVIQQAGGYASGRLLLL
jgi:hypothetical protein